MYALNDFTACVVVNGRMHLKRLLFLFCGNTASAYYEHNMCTGTKVKSEKCNVFETVCLCSISLKCIINWAHCLKLIT